jgi:hypothetical protein
VLFGAAVGGFGLAACGLLPEWLVEAADHPVRRVQHHAGQQRAKHHHQLEHRRDQQRRQDGKSNAPRGGIFPNVGIYVHNYRSVPVQVQGGKLVGGKTAPYAVPDGWGWSTIPTRAGDGTATEKAFIGGAADGDVHVVAVQVGPDHVVWGRNEPERDPLFEIRTGGWDKGGPDKSSQSLDKEGLMVNGIILVDGIKVTRGGNEGGLIRFSVDLT